MNSKTSDPHRLINNLSYKIDFQRSGKYIALSNLSIYCICKNKKKLYKSNKFKISAPTWNEEFGLPDWSYSVADIQDYFKYIIKKHEAVTNNLPIRIH